MRASDFEFRIRFWTIGFLFVVASLPRYSPPVFYLLSLHVGQTAADGLCLLFVAAAAGLRTWAAAYLQPEIIHSREFNADALVADGPFRYVRNPLYLGTILLGAGFGLLYTLAGFLILVGGLWILTLRLTLREEALLAGTQGESYRNYLRRVPRLLPALRPRLPASPGRPNWPKAFRGELFCWLLLAAIFSFFATSSLLPVHARIHLLYVGIWATLIIHLAVQPRRAASSQPVAQDSQ